jgi:hypothetical protein
VSPRGAAPRDAARARDSAPRDGAPRDAARARHPIPRWMFPLGMAVVLEPPLLIGLWLLDRDLAEGSLAGIAMVGGLFVSLPALTIFGLAVAWDRRLSAGVHDVPGLPGALTGPAASRVAAIALVVSTLLMAGMIGLLTGPWGLVALPPLALSFASAWLMARAA